MNPMHEEKVNEVIKNIAETLKATCKRLCKSGGIDVESYSPEEFVLAKILISVAMEQCKDVFYPSSSHLIRDLKNLQHF